MSSHLKERFLQEITPHLSAEDDPNFWIQAFDTVLSDIEALYPEKSKGQEGTFRSTGITSRTPWARSAQGYRSSIGSYWCIGTVKPGVGRWWHQSSLAKRDWSSGPPSHTDRAASASGCAHHLDARDTETAR